MLNFDTLNTLAENAINQEDWLIKEQIGENNLMNAIIEVITKIQISKTLSWHILQGEYDITLIICPCLISIIEKKSLGKYVFKPNLMQNVDEDDETQVFFEMIRLLEYLDAAVIRLLINQE